MNRQDLSTVKDCLLRSDGGISRGVCIFSVLLGAAQLRMRIAF